MVNKVSSKFEAPSILYQGIENNCSVMRYHSLMVEELPADFEVTARAIDDQVIMGFQHKKLPIYGFQYHPESIGHQMDYQHTKLH